MWNSFIVVIQFTGFAVIYFCSRNSSTDSFKKGACVLLGRSSAVVTVKEGCVICVRSYDCDLLQILCKRKDTIVMKQYHRLACRLHCESVI